MLRWIQNIYRLIYSQDMHDLQSLNVFFTHQETFGKYKAIHTGKEVALIACGPSLNRYRPVSGAINVGVNRSFMRDIKLDYIFIQDYTPMKDSIEELVKPEYSDIKKLYGVLPEQYYGDKFKKCTPAIMPESLILRHKAQKYYLYTKRPQFPLKFNTEIDKSWVQDCGSVALSAMQFILFTSPKKIYLVGCDCTSGHFYNTKDGTNCSKLIKPWKELKKFADIHYPETEIISINPVGLRGIFTDFEQI